MGTTLTGTKPKDTYDSLIKVTDNGPISGTAKYLSDGLGNDLPISVSTTNVGIGTSSPSEKLTINGSLGFQQSGTQTYHINPASSVLTFVRSGIADVMSVTANGLCFGSDTAAANALDDYEEGTWTPVFTMGTSGTITTGGVSGRYTKVGNLVTCTGFANVSSVLLPVGELRIGGLPFTTGTASDSGMSIFAYGFANITAVSTYQGFISAGLTYAIVRGFSNGDQVQNIGANVAASAGIIFTITYRV
jgi:hypothetical protein